jgi:hypothetical protein
MFVMLAVGVLVLGISVFNNTNKVSTENYMQRTALSYIANQVRLGDSLDSIDIRDIDGVSALAISQDIDGMAYSTLLYCFEGQLKEMFTEEGLEQELSSGVTIMPLQALYFEEAGKSIKVVVTNDYGITDSLTLSPRSGMTGLIGID